MGRFVYSNGGGFMNLNLRRRFMVDTEKEKPSRLPEEYQEVKYVTIINNSEYGYKNKISLKNDSIPISIFFNNIDYIEIQASIDTQRSNTMLFCGYTEGGTGASPFIYCTTSGSLYDSGADISFVAEGKATFDGTPFFIALKDLQTTTTNRYITFGAWQDATYSGTMNWYYVKLSKNGIVLAELVPCYRKADNSVGFFDLIGGKFIPPHLASNKNAFVAGDKV